MFFPQETQGVCVATVGDSAEFPAFYCRSSGCKSPYHVTSPQEAARLVKSMLDLNIRSGLLLAVPVPEKDALDGKKTESGTRRLCRPLPLSRVMNLRFDLIVQQDASEGSIFSGCDCSHVTASNQSGWVAPVSCNV